MTFRFPDLCRTFAYSPAAGISAVSTLDVDETVEMINYALYFLRNLPHDISFVDELVASDEVWREKIGVMSLDVAVVMLDMARFGSYESSMDSLRSLADATRAAQRSGNPVPTVLATMLCLAAAWANRQDALVAQG